MWTTIPLIVVLPTVYVPILLGLRRWRGCNSAWFLVLVGIALELVPTMLASLMFFGNVGRMWTRGAIFLHVMFAVSGGTLALGLVLCQRCRRASPNRGFDGIPKRES